jgi:exodeoxyribonuclease V alpha subunit
VIAALDAADVTYCLCAPTGRAAKRVAETTGRPASTIHRLLEYQPAANIFARDGAFPLEAEFVIVDEVSMLDALLFYHLLKAVPPDAHLLLVGDTDQLPAVGPGNVLRDLIASEAVPTTTLAELFRQSLGSKIVLAAHDINRGEVPAIGNDQEGDLFFVRTKDADSVSPAVQRLVSERIPARFGLDPFDDVQVISPMHSGPAGVTALNTALQATLNPGGPSVPELRRGDRVFRLGDKVMQIRNNYDKDVYNGDVGRVVEIEGAENRMSVSFPGPAGMSEIEYESSDIEQLVLAYAVSVHKAQGSEFPAIVMPLVTGHYMLLQRNLLYTAITRARQLCVLVGQEKALATAVRTDHRERRNTRLAHRLRVPDDNFLQLELA